MYSSDVSIQTDMKWYQIWWHVWTHPGADAFRMILRDSHANAKRGFFWIAATPVISYLVYFISGFLFGGFELAEEIVFWVCMFIAAPLFGIIGLAISAGIFRYVAGLLGGSGTWDKLVYCFAAIFAPYSLFSIPLGILAPSFMDIGTTPNERLISLTGIAVSIYAIVLFVSAIDAVENTGTGKAVLIYIIPVIILIIIGIALSICLVMGNQ